MSAIRGRHIAQLPLFPEICATFSRKEIREMAFVVQADGPNNDGASAVVQSRKEALALAIQWIGDGHKGIKIIGDGRVYKPEEFAQTIVDP
jgi:hypothetical protein